MSKYVALALISLFSWGLARAQECVHAKDFCQLLTPNVVVFVGRQIAAEGLIGPERVTFSVDEMLWGLEPGMEKVTVSFPNGYLSFKGLRMIAAVTDFNGHYEWDGCHGGFNIALDDDKAKQFREYLRSSTPANLHIRVVADQAHIPLPATKVQLRGPDKSFEGTSDKAGGLTFSPMPPGTYSATADQPNYSLAEGLRFSILPGACSTLQLTMKSASHLSGQILDANGNPVRHTRGFQLFARTDGSGQEYRKSRSFETDEEGKFSLEGVIPGRYYLGTNLWESEPRESLFPRTYYPGVSESKAATLLIIEPGKSLDEIVFHLPDFGKKRHLKAHVVDANGQPVPHALVGDGPEKRDGPIKSDEIPSISLGSTQFTNDQGVAEFDLWEAGKYFIEAQFNSSYPTYQSEIVRIEAGDSPIELTIALKDKK